MERSRYLNRTALVTGGLSGLGRGICEALIREGATVTAVDVRNASRDDGLTSAELLSLWGEGHRVVIGDVSDPEFIAEIFDTGHFDVVFNCAGITNFAPLVDLGFEDYKRIFDVNFGGVFNVCKAAVGSWLDSGGTGTIVNVASNLGLVGTEAGTLYCASKAAVVMFTRSLAVEVGAHGIRANCLCPGVIETQFNADFRSIEANLTAWKSKTPLRRGDQAFGQVEDVAGAALFLGSDESGYMTGSELVIDGGWNAS